MEATITNTVCKYTCGSWLIEIDVCEVVTGNSRAANGTMHIKCSSYLANNIVRPRHQKGWRVVISYKKYSL